MLNVAQLPTDAENPWAWGDRFTRLMILEQPSHQLATWTAPIWMAIEAQGEDPYDYI